MSDACIGPINPATDLPDETCGSEATKILFFPHQSGAAIMFSCDRHLESLGRWAGTRFGNCFAGGPIANSARTMTEAAEQFGPITTPPRRRLQRAARGARHGEAASRTEAIAVGRIHGSMRTA